MSTPISGAIAKKRPAQHEHSKILNCGRLEHSRFGNPAFPQYFAPLLQHRSLTTAEPNNHLDAPKRLTHCKLNAPSPDSVCAYCMSNLVAYIDGGSHGNPGPSGIGIVIHTGSSEESIRIAKWIGRQDNNVAEYVALLEALQCALALRARALHVYSDSQVVVRQMRGEYKCRSPRLYSLNWTCRRLARGLKFSISYIRREHNLEANALANSAVRSGAQGEQVPAAVAEPQFAY